MSIANKSVFIHTITTQSLSVYQICQAFTPEYMQYTYIQVFMACIGVLGVLVCVVSVVCVVYVMHVF